MEVRGGTKINITVRAHNTLLRAPKLQIALSPSLNSYSVTSVTRRAKQMALTKVELYYNASPLGPYFFVFFPPHSPVTFTM